MANLGEGEIVQMEIILKCIYNATAFLFSVLCFSEYRIQ
jgi:hypothetical protein